MTAPGPDVVDTTSVSAVTGARDPAEAPIADTQRSGTMTGMAVVLGFSLTFTATWSQGSGEWRWRGVAVMILAAVGIVLQVRALFSVLSLPPVSVARHQRATRQFQRGVAAVLIGYAAHISLDVLKDIFHVTI